MNRLSASPKPYEIPAPPSDRFDNDHMEDALGPSPPPWAATTKDQASSGPSLLREPSPLLRKPLQEEQAGCCAMLQGYPRAMLPASVRLLLSLRWRTAALVQAQNLGFALQNHLKSDASSCTGKSDCWRVYAALGRNTLLHPFHHRHLLREAACSVSIIIPQYLAWSYQATVKMHYCQVSTRW